VTTETQPQRTVLSWQRTGLSLLAVAALLGHHALREGRVLPAVAAVAVALSGLGVLAEVGRRARQLARGPAAAPRAVAAATAAVAGTAVAAAVVLLSR
jgi:putative membrane protein